MLPAFAITGFTAQNTKHLSLSCASFHIWLKKQIRKTKNFIICARANWKSALQKKIYLMVNDNIKRMDRLVL